MKNDTLQLLTRFHQEVALPDVQRIVDQAVGTLRNEMNTQFDGLFVRILRTEIVDEPYR